MTDAAETRGQEVVPVVTGVSDPDFQGETGHHQKWNPGESLELLLSRSTYQWKTKAAGEMGGGEKQ